MFSKKGSSLPLFDKVKSAQKLLKNVESKVNAERAELEASRKRLEKIANQGKKVIDTIGSRTSKPKV